MLTLIQVSQEAIVCPILCLSRIIGPATRFSLLKMRLFRMLCLRGEGHFGLLPLVYYTLISRSKQRT
jgi:hypothetical protein